MATKSDHKSLEVKIDKTNEPQNQLDKLNERFIMLEQNVSIHN
jgi:hypothetical protein